MELFSVPDEVMKEHQQLSAQEINDLLYIAGLESLPDSRGNLNEAALLYWRMVGALIIGVSDKDTVKSKANEMILLIKKLSEQ